MVTSAVVNPQDGGPCGELLRLASDLASHYGAEDVVEWLLHVAQTLSGKFSEPEPFSPACVSSSDASVGFDTPQCFSEDYAQWKRNNESLFHTLAVASPLRPDPGSASTTPVGVCRRLAVSPNSTPGSPSPAPRLPYQVVQPRPALRGSDVRLPPTPATATKWDRCPPPSLQHPYGDDPASQWRARPCSQRCTPRPSTTGRRSSVLSVVPDALLKLLDDLGSPEWQTRISALAEVGGAVQRHAAVLRRGDDDARRRLIASVAVQLSDKRPVVVKHACTAISQLCSTLADKIPQAELRLLLRPLVAAGAGMNSLTSAAAASCAQTVLDRCSPSPPPFDLVLQTGLRTDRAVALLSACLFASVDRVCDRVLVVAGADLRAEMAVPMGTAVQSLCGLFAAARGVEETAIEVFTLHRGHGDEEKAALCEGRAGLLGAVAECLQADDFAGQRLRSAAQSYWGLYLLFPGQSEELWDALPVHTRACLLRNLPESPRFVVPFSFEPLSQSPPRSYGAAPSPRRASSRAAQQPSSSQHPARRCAASRSASTDTWR
eukprot:TRINITY_DN19136_c0_g1_i1.p1 TRINITY_DN19136_c0_g1~~TRINITY_DN19136_c0_g1_i1.p1  ORF type:complete len:547 (+),score=141.81 TRINITY_DN19136_c0_g1_i1:45-1685(+)